MADDDLNEHIRAALRTLEERLVRELGERIGYGRTMQLAEQLWQKMLTAEGLPAGGELSVGPCAGQLVPCPCPPSGRDANDHCEWCCGSGRVTKRVLAAMEQARPWKHRTQPPRGGRVNVNSHDNGRGRRIVVPLGGVDHVLTEVQATELRYQLTRELGAQQALTDREAMVWAAAFAEAMTGRGRGSIGGDDARDAAIHACAAVGLLREIATEPHRAAANELEAEHDAMLAAMTGGGR